MKERELCMMNKKCYKEKERLKIIIKFYNNTNIHHEFQIKSNQIKYKIECFKT